MTTEFSQDILLRVVAQICKMIGFSTIMTSPLYVLADMMREFICNLGSTARLYGEHCGRTHVNLSDLSLAFHHHGIYPTELVTFLQLVSPLPTAISVPKYPVPMNNWYTLLESPKNTQMTSCDTKESRETLKIRISLSKIKEANAAKKIKSTKKKKNKENRKKKKASKVDCNLNKL